MASAKEKKLYRDLSERFNELRIPSIAFSQASTEEDPLLKSSLEAFFEERAAMIWYSEDGRLTFVGKDKK